MDSTPPAGATDGASPILLLGPCTAFSGNHSTLQRISNYLRAPIVDINVVPSEGAVRECVECLFLHAFRGGQYIWHDASAGPRIVARRYGVIFGGTDVNVMAYEPSAHAFMAAVLSRCAYAVCFSSELAEHARALWGEKLPPVIVIPQAISPPPPSAPVTVLLESVVRSALPAASTHIDSACVFAVLPGAIRPVKCQSFALEAWDHLQRLCSAPRVVLLLVGPVLDQAYFDANVAPALDPGAHSQVLWHSGLDHGSLLALMSHPRVCCVLNVSTSEGQPQAILEAMAMHAPVVVRENRGNRAVVNCERGLLAGTPKELAEAVCLLASQGRGHPAAAARVARAAAYVADVHSLAEERRRYQQLVCPDGRPPL